MTRVAHLFDGSTGWEQRVGVAQLLDRLPRDRYTNHLATIDPIARRDLRRLDHPLEVLPRLGRMWLLDAPSVMRFGIRNGIEVVHAWGVEAARAARTAISTPMIVHYFDPLAAKRDATRLRAMLTLDRPLACLCSSETVRRRLIEGGFPTEQTVVIRPGVDFAIINAARRGPLREQLGFTRDEHLVVVPEPVTRAGGQFDGVHATLLTNHVSGGLGVVVPGRSAEQRRIARFIRTLPISQLVVMPGDQHPFERLVAIADALLLTPRCDVSTTSVAWAMAAGAAVIGTAVYSIAELIAHRLNGFLFKQTPGRSMNAPISKLLRDRASQEKAKEAARGQAYEVFGLRRYVEQTMRLYDNLVASRAPGEGITDSAVHC